MYVERILSDKEVHQMTAVKAYYNGSVFVPVEPVKARRNQAAIITILDFSSENPEEVNDICHRQREALERFRVAMQNCDEPIPEFERIQLSDIDI